MSKAATPPRGSGASSEHAGAARGRPHAAVSIVGAGPTGALLAILLRREGVDVTMYEAREDPRGNAGDSGRSINLALADRGIHSLRLAGVYEEIAPTLVAMRGRLIHQLDGQALLPYGQRPSEVIYSISRHRLNQVLLDVAIRRHGVDVKFGHRVEAADFGSGMLRLRDTVRDVPIEIPMAPAPVLATDGAGSVLRHAMSSHALIALTEARLEHGYKELSIPADAHGAYAMAHDVLHIWPRGDFMLIALPNHDGSFTATLFLANTGPVSFAALDSPAAIERFLATEFPDVYALMPACIDEFQRHPTGFLGTVYADTWHVGGMAALLGDSAHAIVPFHGQGMNCCFEDCVAFTGCLQRAADWQSVFESFFAVRKPNTDAIAAMALENYREMRERVVDPRFRLQQALSLELERRHPQRFIPRYSMVMFHHEIPYSVARGRGAIQTTLLGELTQDATTLADVDYARAARDIELRLPPLLPAPAPTS